MAFPTRKALQLSSNSPSHYTFDFGESGRQVFIEDLYRSLNDAGDLLSEDQKIQVVEECRVAFRCNVEMYSEEPYYVDAAKGLYNIAKGVVLS